MRVALFVYGRFSTGPLQGTEECKKGETFPRSGRKRIVTKGRRPSTEDAATRLFEQPRHPGRIPARSRAENIVTQPRER